MTDQETIRDFVMPNGELNPDNLILAATGSGRTITIFIEDDAAVRCGCSISAGPCHDNNTPKDKVAYELVIKFCDIHEGA